MSVCCQLTTYYSAALWKYISDVYSHTGMRVSELGITNDLVYRFVALYSKRSPALCDVYVKHSPDEKTRGADIELNIFDSSRRGKRYFIQAKKMDYTGEYLDIKKWSIAKNTQYQKLVDWANGHKGMPLYLLYNGSSNKSTTGGPDLGLAIVDANVIRNYRYNQNYRRQNKSVTFLSFDLLNGLGMVPFSTLFCPGTASKFQPKETITMDDIEVGPSYRKVSEKNTQETTKEVIDVSNDGPQYKIVIRDGPSIEGLTNERTASIN